VRCTMWPGFIWWFRFAGPDGRIDPTEIGQGFFNGKLYLTCLDVVLHPQWLRHIQVFLGPGGGWWLKRWMARITKLFPREGPPSTQLINLRVQ
jgi:hypothetical protein